MEQRHHQELGAYLRQCRESLNHKLNDISTQLNIRIRYLQAIEEGNFDMLPGSVYTEGYLKNYALFLDLDPKEVLNRYRASGAHKKEEQETKEFLLPEPYNDNSTPSHAILKICVAAIVVVYAGWYYFSEVYNKAAEQASSEKMAVESLASPLEPEDMVILGIRTGKLQVNEVDPQALKGLDMDDDYQLPQGADAAKMQQELEAAALEELQQKAEEEARKAKEKAAAEAKKKKEETPAAGQEAPSEAAPVTEVKPEPPEPEEGFLAPRESMKPFNSRRR